VEEARGAGSESNTWFHHPSLAEKLCLRNPPAALRDELCADGAADRPALAGSEAWLRIQGEEDPCHRGNNEQTHRQPEEQRARFAAPLAPRGPGKE
jgi:hypothetical protein